MFQPLMQQPWKFADGTFLETFQHERTGLGVYHDGDIVYAFCINWPVPKSLTQTYWVSWHRDHGLRTEIATAGPHPDLGQIRPHSPPEYERAIEVVERDEGAGIPTKFRDTILDMLRQSI
jgi:hypothetical protein